MNNNNFVLMANWLDQPTIVVDGNKFITSNSKKSKKTFNEQINNKGNNEKVEENNYDKRD